MKVKIRSVRWLLYHAPTSALMDLNYEERESDGHITINVHLDILYDIEITLEVTTTPTGNDFFVDLYFKLQSGSFSLIFNEEQVFDSILTLIENMVKKSYVVLVLEDEEKEVDVSDVEDEESKES